MRAAVKVRVEPETYDYNQWSQWVEQPTGAWSATTPSAGTKACLLTGMLLSAAILTP